MFRRAASELNMSSRSCCSSMGGDDDEVDSMLFAGMDGGNHVEMKLKRVSSEMLLGGGGSIRIPITGHASDPYHLHCMGSDDGEDVMDCQEDRADDGRDLEVRYCGESASCYPARGTSDCLSGAAAAAMGPGSIGCGHSSSLSSSGMAVGIPVMSSDGGVFVSRPWQGGGDVHPAWEQGPEGESSDAADGSMVSEHFVWGASGAGEVDSPRPPPLLEVGGGGFSRGASALRITTDSSRSMSSDWGGDCGGENDGIMDCVDHSPGLQLEHIPKVAEVVTVAAGAAYPPPGAAGAGKGCASDQFKTERPRAGGVGGGGLDACAPCADAGGGSSGSCAGGGGGGGGSIEPSNPTAVVGGLSASLAEARGLLPPPEPLVDPAIAQASPFSALDQFSDLRQIGSGCSARVYLGRCRGTGEELVVKVIDKAGGAAGAGGAGDGARAMTPMRRRHIQREVRIHSNFKHENAVGFRGAWEDGGSVCIVQEFAGGGDLFNLLEKCGGRLSEHTVITKILRPLLLSLGSLHARGVVHRDIKPENIFFSTEGVLKLGDFGLSVNMREEPAVERLGTLDYMAPEVIAIPRKSEQAAGGQAAGPPAAASAYGAGVDVWAVGVLGFELIDGFPPFEVESEELTCAMILWSEVQAWPEGISPACRDFLSACLRKDPRKRPTVHDLLSHPWVVAHCPPEQA